MIMKLHLKEQDLHDLFYLKNGVLHRKLLLDCSRFNGWVKGNWNVKANKEFSLPTLKIEGFHQLQKNFVIDTLQHGIKEAKKMQEERAKKLQMLGSANKNRKRNATAAIYIEPYIYQKKSNGNYVIRVKIKNDTKQKTTKTYEEAKQVLADFLSQKEMYVMPDSKSIHQHRPSQNNAHIKATAASATIRRLNKTEKPPTVAYKQQTILKQPHDYNADLYPADFYDTNANTLTDCLGIYG